jgi:hypothetical protein
MDFANDSGIISRSASKHVSCQACVSVLYSDDINLAGQAVATLTTHLPLLADSFSARREVSTPRLERIYRCRNIIPVVHGVGSDLRASKLLGIRHGILRSRHLRYSEDQQCGPSIVTDSRDAFHRK